MTNQIQYAKIRNTKFEAPNKSEALNSKLYNLEDRTLEFGKRIIRLCKTLPKSTVNNCLLIQVMRSGTSLGANYREANETDTKRDFKNRIRISKKEAKETIYWLELIVEANLRLKERILPLLQETRELMKILGSIYEKTVKSKS
ncbi:MAG: four helix bundle protein [Candidatus Cloacimonetes bacterium]|nr:four helix bundle protein [Candidatus Cloacimonadota bacterium]